jgi:hypothetical protein
VRSGPHQSTLTTKTSASPARVSLNVDVLVGVTADGDYHGAQPELSQTLNDVWHGKVGLAPPVLGQDLPSWGQRCGAHGRIRTCILLVRSQMLIQLSYVSQTRGRVAAPASIPSHFISY